MRISAKQRAYETVKRDLLEGRIRPGERIIDADVAARLHVSRMPVREALLALERERWVRIVPRQGYFASEISVHDALDAYQLRLILEPIATAMAATHITDEEVQALRALAEVGQDESETDFTRAIKTNRAFHIGIAEATRNARLARIMADLLDELDRLAYVELRGRGSAAAWASEHLEIVAALEQRDPARAAAVARATFQQDEGLLPLNVRTNVLHVVDQTHDLTPPGPGTVGGDDHEPPTR